MKNFSIKSLKSVKETIIAFAVPTILSGVFAFSPNILTGILMVFSLAAYPIGFAFSSESRSSDNFESTLKERYREAAAGISFGIYIFFVSGRIALSFNNSFFEVLAYLGLAASLFSFIKLWPKNLNLDQQKWIEIISQCIEQNQYTLKNISESDIELDHAKFNHKNYKIEINNDQIIATEKISGQSNDISKLWNWTLKFYVIRELLLNEKNNLELKQKFILSQIRESISRGTYTLSSFNKKKEEFEGVFLAPQLKIRIEEKNGLKMLIEKESYVEVDASDICDYTLYGKVFSMIEQKEKDGKIIEEDQQLVDDLLIKALQQKLNTNKDIGE